MPVSTICPIKGQRNVKASHQGLAFIYVFADYATLLAASPFREIKAAGYKIFSLSNIMLHAMLYVMSYVISGLAILQVTSKSIFQLTERANII